MTTVFTFWEETTGSNIRDATIAVMNSFSGLEEFSISTYLSPLPRPHAGVQHYRTLTSLTICSQDYRVYEFDELADILNACPILTQLALDLPERAIGAGDAWEHDWKLRLNCNAHEALAPLHAALVSTR
jgi:hypothetical protein